MSDDCPASLRESARSLLRLRAEYPEAWRQIFRLLSDEDLSTLRELAEEEADANQ